MFNPIIFCQIWGVIMPDQSLNTNSFTGKHSVHDDFFILVAPVAVDLKF